MTQVGCVRRAPWPTVSVVCLGAGRLGICRNQAGTGLNERTGKLGAMPGDDMRGVRFMACCQPSANARHRRMGRQLA